MAICNRDLDVSQQKVVIQSNLGAVATALTVPVGIVPFPAVIVDAKIAALGLSGAPTGLLKINRFIVGSGATIYTGGFTTVTVVAVGTSGVQDIPQAAAGSTALQLQAGDELVWTSATANTAVQSLAVSVVIQATQDIKTFFGS